MIKSSFRSLSILACLIISLFFLNCLGNKNKSVAVQKKDSTNQITTTKSSDNIKPDKQLNEIARFIAGMPVDSFSELYTLTQKSEWINYQKESEQIWKKFDTYKSKITTWITNEKILQIGDTIKTVFYPFSGPDYLFADVFFPSADKYILIGLEGVGHIPIPDSLKKKSHINTLSSFRTAINDIMCLSFFKTNDMKKDLTTDVVDGTIPVLMMFFARTGKEIIRIIPMKLNEEGKLISLSNDELNHSKYNAVEILFKENSSVKVKSLIYFSADLTNYAINKKIPFQTFLSEIKHPLITYVKSATYLMHKSYFSFVRDFILTNSSIVFQDDSGIPYTHFEQDKWDVKLYGTYVKPINMFKDYYQEELLADFQKKSKPINFRIGYNSISNLMLAIKK